MGDSSPAVLREFHHVEVQKGVTELDAVQVHGSGPGRRVRCRPMTTRPVTTVDRTPQRLCALQPGQLVPFGGDRVAVVDDELAAAFAEGDRLVVVQDSGALLHIPLAEHALVRAAVDAAVGAFEALAGVSDEQITEFF
ncbi:MAG: proA, partial [Acidimicrobiales bacterium]|nr:proA [Acidimicrobiales bacterium]